MLFFHQMLDVHLNVVCDLLRGNNTYQQNKYQRLSSTLVQHCSCSQTEPYVSSVRVPNAAKQA